MAGIKRISAIESLMEKTQKAVKESAKSVAENIKDNKGRYAAALGVTAAAGGIAHTLNKDEIEVGHYKVTDYETDIDGVPLDSPIGYVPKMEWTNDPTFFQKLQLKIRDTFKLDLDNPPKFINPADPYLTDNAGHYIMDDYGVMPNPWYNPDLAKASVEKAGSAVESLGFNKVSMKDFLANAAAHSKAADASFTGIDIVENTDGSVMSEAGDSFISEAKSNVLEKTMDNDTFIDHAVEAFKHLIDYLT